MSRLRISSTFNCILYIFLNYGNKTFDRFYVLPFHRYDFETPEEYFMGQFYKTFDLTSTKAALKMLFKLIP